MARCLYNSDFATFLYTDSDSIYRILDDNYHGEALTTTRDAWKAEIEIMKNVVSKFRDANGQVIFEYDIPRLGKRIDVVLLYRGIVFCLEFKVGESKILETNIDQVLDYALDLKNFHKFSEDKVIVPILIATNYSSRSSSIQMSVYDDRVVKPLVTGKAGISALIEIVLNKFPKETPVHKDWIISPYAPTPIIVEAAKTLYESHSVENITKHEADKVSTDATIHHHFFNQQSGQFRCQSGGFSNCRPNFTTAALAFLFLLFLFRLCSYGGKSIVGACDFLVVHSLFRFVGVHIYLAHDEAFKQALFVILQGFNLPFIFRTFGHI